jgi:hypothetical protein
MRCQRRGLLRRQGGICPPELAEEPQAAFNKEPAHVSHSRHRQRPARLRQAGVSEGEIIEIVANTVVNIFTNYLNHVAGTDIDLPVMRADVAAVA